MSAKDYGGGVSQNPQTVVPGAGQFTAEQHSWETVVFQQGKNPIDWEVELLQEINSDFGNRDLVQRLHPSGFMNDILDRSDLSNFYIFQKDQPASVALAAANTFATKACDMIINGWRLRFEYSDSPTAGSNIIAINGPPASIGSQRTDLVIIEAWRALVKPIPDTINKSATGLIFRHGNVKAPDLVNLADDILDPTVLSETALRVQIQYRYRVINGIDLTSFPDGLDDSTVFANSTPTYGPFVPDGSSTGFSYSKHPTDPGLWVAGDGSPPNALGTVDGFMYAIPLCAIFRRNAATFKTKISGSPNQNGGTSFAFASDRPDGLFADRIDPVDIKDLRKTIASDFNEVGQKTFQQLLDNALETEHFIMGSLSPTLPTDGTSGTSNFISDLLGTPPGSIGNPDGVRTHFSDRSVSVNVVVKQIVFPLSTTVPTISIASLDVVQGPIAPGPPGIFTYLVGSLAPIGTRFSGVGKIRLSDDASFDIPATIANIIMTDTTIDITLASPHSGPVYVEIQLTYPSQQGMLRTSIANHQLWIPLPGPSIPAWVDTAGAFPPFFPTLTPAPDVPSTGQILPTSLWAVDPSHREIVVRFQTVALTMTLIATIPPEVSIHIPEKVADIIAVSGSSSGVHPGPPFGTLDNVNAAYPKFTPFVAFDPGETVTITYTAFRALPPVVGLDTYQIFYQARAPQTIITPTPIVTVDLIPRWIDQNLYVITSGPASPDDSFPFISPSIQLPIGLTPAASFPESLLDSPARITLSDFEANTGFVQLSSFLPYTPNTGQVRFHIEPGDLRLDDELRSFWPRANIPAPLSVFYAPTAFAQSLTHPERHKVALPTIMELKEDKPGIGRKGTLFMVVFTRWFEFNNPIDPGNANIIRFDDLDPSDTVASIYRVRGNLINPRQALGPAPVIP